MTRQVLDSFEADPDVMSRWVSLNHVGLLTIPTSTGYVADMECGYIRVWEYGILEQLLMLFLQEEPAFFQTLILYEENTRRILFMAQ